jgi:outer membrane protein OmpA-like peptidoglycan-associated protein
MWVDGLVGLVLAAGAGLAERAELPAGLALPAAVRLKQAQVHEYDSVEVSVARPDGGCRSTRPVGRRATLVLQPADGKTLPTPEAWKAALGPLGWTVLCDSAGQLTFSQERGATSRWLKVGWPAVELIDAAEPVPVVLAPPTSPATPLQKDRDWPFLAPPRQATLTRWARRSPCHFEAGDDQGRAFTGECHDVRYQVPRYGALEAQATYVVGLNNAGWSIVHTSTGGMTTAHYAKSGRDLWLQVFGSDDALSATVLDLGGMAEPARLRAALDHAGRAVVYGVYFEPDAPTPTADSEPTLQQIAALLQSDPKLKLRVEVHAEKGGTVEHARELTQQRAKAVSDWLFLHHVEPERLQAEGLGDTRPVADNATSAGRAQNRRVELVRF